MRKDLRQDEGLGTTQGGRRPTEVVPASEGKQNGLAGTDPSPANGSVRRWTASRKREVVLRLLRGEPITDLSRELGVEIYRLEKWRDAALNGLQEGLKERAGDPLKAELDAAMRHIGELSMENELLRERCRRQVPFLKGKSKR